MTTPSPLSPALIAFGAVYRPAVVASGQPFWRLISADGPGEWGGRHSVYVDLWDEAGNRVVGVPVVFYWQDDQNVKPTELKPGEPFALDFPMYAGGNSYGIRVGDSLPSDDIFGMGLVPFGKHVVFKLIWQRAVAAAAPDPEPLPTPPGAEPPATATYARAEIEEVMTHLRLANEQLAKGLLPR